MLRGDEPLEHKDGPAARTSAFLRVAVIAVIHIDMLAHSGGGDVDAVCLEADANAHGVAIISIAGLCGA